MEYGSGYNRMPNNQSSFQAKIEEMEAVAELQISKPQNTQNNWDQRNNWDDRSDTGSPSRVSGKHFRGRNWRNYNGRPNKRFYPNHRGRGGGIRWNESDSDNWRGGSGQHAPRSNPGEDISYRPQFEGRQYYDAPRGPSSSRRGYGPRGGRGRGAYAPSAVSQSNAPSNNVIPTQLIKSLAKFPEFSATLLTLMDRFEYSHKQVRNIIAVNTNIFELEMETVKLRPKIKVCEEHLDTDGCSSRSSCIDLHICDKFISGNCKCKGCLCGHNLFTNHNKQVLKQLHMSTLDLKLLLNILRLTIPCTDSKELKVCKEYNNHRCQKNKCTELHLCIKHLAKSCPDGDECKLCHSLSEEKVVSVLEQHGMPVNETPRDIWLAIVSCPLVKKEIEAVKRKSDLMNDGQDKTEAKTQNSEPPIEKSPLKSTSPPQIEKPIPKTIWSHEFVGEVRVPEICFNSVDNFCPDEERGCSRLHCDSHFHWQVRAKTMENQLWVNLTKSQSLALEAAFCDPAVMEVDMPPLEPSTLQASAKKLLLILSGRSKWIADFKSMELKLKNKKNSLELRRLCTQSKPSEDIAPCTFKWYFVDKNAKWIEYGNIDSTGEEQLKCNLTSDVIEGHFKQNPTVVIQFQNQSFQYRLDLGKMAQTNTQTNVVREVMRRPAPHISAKKTDTGDRSDIPSSWDAMQPDERFKRITLAPSSDEYKKLIAYIQTKGSNLKIGKVERIQNLYLWRAFQNKVQELTSLYKNKDAVNIQQLFHGTKPDIVPKICEENFDWRLHGTNVGQAYGRGTYFSPNPSTAHGYTNPDASGQRFMFVAQVTVGTLTAGNPSMTRPPINPQYNVPFDSTADNPLGPNIIVKYDKQEYFPEYVLTVV